MITDPKHLAKQLTSRAKAVQHAARSEQDPAYQAALMVEANLLQESARCILRQDAIIREVSRGQGG
jgi:hypothetical protein